MALMDLDQNTAVPAACCSGSGARAMKSKSHSNKNSHPDGRAKFLDTKNFIKKKKVSKSPLKKRSIEKEENYGSEEQKEVIEDLTENFPVVKEHFDVLSKVGEGTFSKVYLARIRLYPKEKVAIKHIVPTSSPTRVKNELSCLQCLGGSNNIIGVKTTLRNNDHTAFILPYFKHEKFQTYFRHLTVGEIKEYMRNLFAALKQVHSYNIIHRDVKPSNFLHSRKAKRYLLVDFGLAMQVPGTTGILSSTDDVSAIAAANKAKEKPQNKRDGSKTAQEDLKRNAVKNSLARGERVTARSARIKTEIKSKSEVLCKHGGQPGHTASSICTFCCSRSGQIAPRAGTPGFRSPEVLMKLPSQTTAVDIWSAGIILLSFLSGRYPFFKAKDDLTSLAQIITVFGSKEASRTANLIGKDLICSSTIPHYELKSLCERLRQKTCRYHDRKRKKRKYPQRDVISKKAKIEEEEVSRKFNELNVDSRSGNLKDSSAENSTEKRKKRVGGQGSPVTRSQSKICKELDGDLCQAANNSPECTVSSSVSSEGSAKRISGKLGDGDKSVTSSREDKIDCYCIPDDAYDLLSQCLQLNPLQRITAAEALEHQFLNS